MVLSDDVVRLRWLICKGRCHWLCLGPSTFHPNKAQELLLTTRTCTYKRLLRAQQHQYCISNSRPLYFHRANILNPKIQYTLSCFPIPTFTPSFITNTSFFNPSLLRPQQRIIYLGRNSRLLPFPLPFQKSRSRYDQPNPASFFPSLSTLPSETPFLTHINSSTSSAVPLGSTPFNSLMEQNHITPTPPSPPPLPCCAHLSPPDQHPTLISQRPSSP